MSRMFITGATGFIGKHLLEKLKDSSHEVILFSRNPQATTPWENINGSVEDSDLAKKFPGNIDIVINLMGNKREAERFFPVNARGTENLVKAAKEHGVKRFFHLSSVGVYGIPWSGRPRIVDENIRPEPKNSYEKSKLKGEKALHHGQNDFLFPQTVILRPTNVFGEHNPEYPLLRMMRRIQQGKLLPLTPGAKVNFVYAGDVASAIMFFIDKPEHSGIYNAGDSMLLEYWLSHIANLLGKKPEIMKVPGFLISATAFFAGPYQPYLESLNNKVEFSGSRLSQLTGLEFRPLTGLVKLLEFYRNQKLIS